jgi:D-alanyl-D-alanine carboxypeptidase
MPSLPRLLLTTLLAVTLFTLGAKAAPPATASASTQAGAVGEAVRASMAGVLTGEVLVAKGGHIVWRGVLGDLDQGIAPPPQGALYDAASIGKTFTAAAVQRLAAAGRIDLTSPLRRYLPELPAETTDATVKHTLDNNAGWPRYLEGGDFDPRTAADVVRELAATPLDHEAGIGARYSNTGFQALGVVVERLTGQSHPQALRRLVLEPAGMVDTVPFGDPALKARAVAPGYVDGQAKGSIAEWPNTWSLLGAAGYATTVADLYRFNRHFLAGNGLGAVGRARMLAPGAPSRGGPMKDEDTLNISYGSGLYHWTDRKGRHIHFHGGDGDYGYSAMMYWREEDDLAIIGLFNSVRPRAEDGPYTVPNFRSRLVAAVSTALGG